MADHADGCIAEDGLDGILANFSTSRDDCVDASTCSVFEGAVASIDGAWTSIIARVEREDTSVSRIALIKSTDVSISTVDGCVDASQVEIARIGCAGISIIAVSRGMDTSVSSNSGCARVIGTETSIVAIVRADAISSASAESSASKSTWIAGNIDASSYNQSIQNLGKGSKTISKEGSVDSGEGRSNVGNLLSINIASNTNGEDGDASILNGSQDSVQISIGVDSVSENDEDSVDWSFVEILSSKLGDLIIGELDTTANASGSSVLISKSQLLNEFGLRCCKRNDESSSS